MKKWQVIFLHCTGQTRAYEQFARWLNQPDKDALHELSKLPGFVSVSQSVPREMSKHDVLKCMDNLRIENLPVVNKDGFFVGTVERSQLTASLILGVVSRLVGEAAGSLKPRSK